MTKVFTSTFLSSNLKRCFNLTKTFKKEVKKKFDFWYCFNFFPNHVYNSVSMTSFVLIEDYRLKFAWIHNHAIIWLSVNQFIAFSLSNSRY